MSTPDLSSLRVAILATTGFEQSEFSKPRKALDDAGATTTFVSPQDGEVKAWDSDDWGDAFSPDVQLSSANASDYDALLLPGGVMNPDLLRNNEDAVAFVQHFVDADKPIAAICHGPWTLVETGFVKGKRMTSYGSIQTDLKNAGAQWVDEEAVVDGSLITSRKPDDIPAFNDAMLRVFSEVAETA